MPAELSPAQQATARDRIGRVFRYLQELHRVKTPPRVDLDEYAWRLTLDTLPSDPSIHRADGDDALEPGTLLQVGRATDDWEQCPSSAIEALGVFAELFELRGRFERESERFQLFLGDGILVADGPDGKVRHPVLLQRVELEFNPSLPEFTIRDSDDNPELYLPMLRHLGVDGKQLLELARAFDEQPLHPLSGEPATQFLTDLVQRFWPDGKFVDGESAAAAAGGPSVYRRPFFYLGNRSQGFVEAVERYLDHLPELDPLPESLLRIVGIDAQRPAAEPDAPAESLMLTEHANPEQEEVVRRLAETGAVLVQGPPGTGKSHTIANLIGHLLAQGKSILVTSHASKALRIVREKVASPLQSLCVSVLGSDEGSTKQLEESITDIVNFVTSASLPRLYERIEQLHQQRATLEQTHAELSATLLDAVAQESQELDVRGERLTPADAARELAAGRGVHDWIPAPIAGTIELPLGADEIGELYRLVASIAAGDEAELAAVLPNSERLPSPRQLAEHRAAAERLDANDLKRGRKYWFDDEPSPDTLAELRDVARRAAEPFRSGEEWVIECLAAGARGREASEPWIELVNLVRRCGERIPPRQELILAHGPEIAADVPTDECLAVCTVIVEHLAAGKKLHRLSRLFNRSWQALIDASRVDGGRPSTLVQFRSLADYLEVRSLRESLQRRWDRQMAPLGAPPAAELGPEPEVAAVAYTERIVAALRWSSTALPECEAAARDAGLDWVRLLSNARADRPIREDLRRLCSVLVELLPPILETRAQYAERAALTARQDEWLAYLKAFSDKQPLRALVKQLRRGIQKGDTDAYERAWARLRELHEKRPRLQRRDSLLRTLEGAAPAWVAALREHRPPHDRGEPPGDVAAAWRHAIWAHRLDELAGVDLDALQADIERTQLELHDVTARYVETRAWAAQVENTGLEQQQALAGWLALHKKMGKGKGKYAARLKEEAKKTLVACRQAVPVWIMPLSRVVESFDPARTRFDVVILDEASQSDVRGLIAMALAKDVAVVGDHEQVSPYAVGHQMDRIQALIDEMLEGIPNKQLYDGKTSVYDLARQSFGGTIRLLEHFRCVPDIIEFSNSLCYGGEILPLREAAAGRVTPHLVAHRVLDGVSRDKRNIPEALEIASLVTAMCRMPEYDGLTMGVISMVGTDQALYIDSILRKRLSVSEYQSRRLLCGNASQFQGDERDVILLSMVDSPSGRPLAMRQREDARKVFNVAASRARDQLWVVHSLDPQRDLKPGDLRLALISHAQDPRATRLDTEDGELSRRSSELVHAICDHLRGRSYRVLLDRTVGHMSLDLVVEGRSGKRVAIAICGDRGGTGDDARAGLTRQLALERLGWTFVRVRASRFFTDPDSELQRLERRLGDEGIEPTGAPEEPAQPASLGELVARRAETIRGRWKRVPTIPDRQPAQRAQTAS